MGIAVTERITEFLLLFNSILELNKINIFILLDSRYIYIYFMICIDCGQNYALTNEQTKLQAPFQRAPVRQNAALSSRQFANVYAYLSRRIFSTLILCTNCLVRRQRIP